MGQGREDAGRRRGTPASPDDPADGPSLDDATVLRSTRVGRLVRAHPWAGSTALGASVLLVGAVTAVAAGETVFGAVSLGLLSPEGRVADLAVPAWLAGAAAGALVLAARDARPLAVTAVLTVLAVASLGSAGVLGVLGLCLAWSLRAVASRRTTRTAVAVAVGVLVVVAVAAARWQVIGLAEVVGWGTAGPLASAGGPPVQQLEVPDPSAGRRALTVLLLAALLALGVASGEVVKDRRRHARALVERYAALARERDAGAALARQAERARIAREVHDVVAHSVSVMVALSDGALSASSRAPERSREAMAAVSRTGREALADMRSVLGTLHAEDDGDLLESSTRPTSTDLRATVERFRAAGLAVRAEGLATPLPVDTAARLAVVRVVGEALTNALRHAPGSSTAVRVHRDATALRVAVVSTGGTPTASDAGSGRGVVGMRERAALVGGRLDVGPLEDGGWAVLLELPAAPDAPPPPDAPRRPAPPAGDGS
ncbi:histidine kinase [Pseudokineococcus marinus]|uniref:sensor histidine kinase n=2 Tax=Pseudokineococcus marinus TaxID=351215 RepID=UPI0030B46DFC